MTSTVGSPTRDRPRGPARWWRAFRRQIATAVGRVVDLHFDPAFGSETRRIVETSDMSDVASRNRARGIRYQPTPALPLKRVLRAARIPTDGVFVDLGCGKGRALIVAVLAGFERVTGVDYSPDLCRAAERNLAEFRARTSRAFTSRVLAVDAADHAFATADSVVFLFNPFDATVLSAVLARLRKSIADHPRTVWIVYHHPVCRDAMERMEWLEWTGDYSFGGCEFAVYRSRPVTD